MTIFLLITAFIGWLFASALWLLLAMTEKDEAAAYRLGQENGKCDCCQCSCGCCD